MYIYLFIFKYEHFLGVTCFLSFDGTWSMLCKEYKNFTRITESVLLTLTTLNMIARSPHPFPNHNENINRLNKSSKIIFKCLGSDSSYADNSCMIGHGCKFTGAFLT